jgi:hypothetical protein
MGSSLTAEEQYESIPFPEIPQALTLAVRLAGSATSWRRTYVFYFVILAVFLALLQARNRYDRA